VAAVVVQPPRAEREINPFNRRSSTCVVNHQG
jgi:hypothetical protein